MLQWLKHACKHTNIDWKQCVRTVHQVHEDLIVCLKYKNYWARESTVKACNSHTLRVTPIQPLSRSPVPQEKKTTKLQQVNLAIFKK